MIGQLVIQALRLGGASRVIAVDVDDAKLERAAALGADVTMNGNKVDVPGAVRDLTSGRGADIAAEVVGASQPMQTAIASLRKGGALTLVGNVSPAVELPLQAVVTRQLRLTGSCASSGEYPVCIDLIASGAIRVKDMISAVAPLEEGPQWFHRLYHKEPNLMKVILKP
jgi:L-iditol 2-dehydrogenase